MIENSPFVHTDPVIPPMFAGRDSELNIINKIIFEDGESMAIFGNDAIGKSSILKTIHSHLISNKQNKVLPIAINAFDFLLAVEGNFLGLATHQICAAIWTRLMNRNYSELIEDTLLNVRGGAALNSAQEIAIKRIFRIVTSDKLSGVGKFNQEIGGKFFLEGKLTQASELTSQRKPLAPFEFLLLLDELIEIIKCYNYESLLIVCDELNHLPNQTNSEFLRSYFDIFSSRKIRFLITIVNPTDFGKRDAELLLDSFNQPLEIGHFKRIEDIQQLVFNVLQLNGDKVYFDKDTFPLLFEITDGHPWWIQKICDAAYKEIYFSKDDRLINTDLIQKHSRTFDDEMNIYKQLIASGQHFRKYHLKR